MILQIQVCPLFIIDDTFPEMEYVRGVCNILYRIQDYVQNRILLGKDEAGMRIKKRSDIQFVYVLVLPVPSVLYIFIEKFSMNLLKT